MNIAGVTGLTEAQRDALLVLGLWRVGKVLAYIQQHHG